MIIQALNDYYSILAKDPDIEIAREGYSLAKVKLALTLSKNGELLDIVRLSEGDKDWVEMIVPEQKKRQGKKPPPYYLCDNSKYVLGWDFDPQSNCLSKESFTLFKELHLKILRECESLKGKALVSFLKKWNPDNCLSNELISSKLDILIKTKGGNMVFRIDGETDYLHHDNDLLVARSKSNLNIRNESYISQCLITGNTETIEKTHPNIKGVKGANTTGATIVGVNERAFESYNKKQGYNSPISKKAAFAYTTVLNYMLNSKRHRLQIGDATTVFWAEDTSGECENLLQELLMPNEQEEKNSLYDAKTIEYVQNSLQRLREGKPIKEKSDVNSYILGLSPNNARLSIRFWYRDSFGNLIAKVWDHYNDMEIIKPEAKQQLISISRILYETIPRNAQKKESAPLLSGALMRSVFTGDRYPTGLFYAIVNRIRADGDVNYIRAGIIKAYLKRNARLDKNNQKEVMLTVSLNQENTNVAYRLGRLFAVLEKAQRDAAGGQINSTIKNKYFGTASASPKAVFPVLLKLAQHHINKHQYGYTIDNKIQEIVKGIDGFPAHLDSEGQGIFILGYYHQRESLYQKLVSSVEEE